MTNAREHPVRNGVDTSTLFATLDAVEAMPQLAKFTFRASNHWISGTHSQSTIHRFHGAMAEMAHQESYTCDADHPAVLCGSDNGPTPVELVLHALAGCLTAGLATIAAARGVELTEVESTVEGDIDLLGFLGLSDDVRTGCQQIRISCTDPWRRPRAAARRRRTAPADARPSSTSITNGVPVADRHRRRLTVLPT